jgi:3'-phosphoadenosine 5'-phosphosulfate sulfotransferase (PAPS reductase)/FAD synthetase
LKTYLSLGAGVQSSTLALMAAVGEVTPMPDGAIFADTQAEPAGVYRWLDWLEKRLPYPVHRVTAGDLRKAVLASHVSKKGVVYYRTAIPAKAG